MIRDLLMANFAAWAGGAIYADYGSSPVFVSCTFSNNTTTGKGGAVFTDDLASQVGISSPIFSCCLFMNNRASFRGGALYNFDGSGSAVSNSIFSGNIAGTEDVLSGRDWLSNPTILSGNIGNASIANDNSFHVVSCTNATGAVIDGFTILDGYADGPNLGGAGNTNMNSTSAAAIVDAINHGAGGGIINFQAAATVRNCIISNNFAMKAGGAYNMVSTTAQGSDSDPNPYFENCTFVNNAASTRGGAVQNDVATHPTFVNCRFIDNICSAKGGGMYNDFYCSPFLTNCIFAGNYAIMAGALGNDGSSSPTLSHCVFAGNEAWDKGAAIYNGSHNAAAPANLPTLINCILYGNKITTAPGPTDIETWHDNTPSISDLLQ